MSVRQSVKAQREKNLNSFSRMFSLLLAVLYVQLFDILNFHGVILVLAFRCQCPFLRIPVKSTGK